MALPRLPSHLPKGVSGNPLKTGIPQFEGSLLGILLFWGFQFFLHLNMLYPVCWPAGGRNATQRQVIRQWDVLQALSSAKQGLTLDDLLTALPEEYARHTRTLRRDLEALEVAGFPLINERLDGRVRWRLIDGFGRIPARTFSPTELMALVMSRHLLKPLDGTQVQASLDSALKKAAAALPQAGRDLADQVQGVFAVGLGPHKTYRHYRETIDRLTQAITKKITIQMRYDSASRGRLTRREVDPYRLWYASGGLYLVGYCHLRKEVRLFAVERIKTASLTDHPYQLPIGFDLEQYVEDALTVMRGPRMEVELLFEKGTAAWVKDRIWHPSQTTKRLKGGQLRMTLTIADTRELLGWVLSFGSGVQVVRPDSLRAAVKQEAGRILESL